MEAARAVQRGLVTPDRTTLIASTHRVYAMTEKIALGDGRVDSDAMLEACRTAAKQLIACDMAALAEATNSVISSVLFGALAGAGTLPAQRMAFEAAIRRGGVGVKDSLNAFAAGFAAAEGGVAAAAPASASDALISRKLAGLLVEAGKFPMPAQEFVRAGVERLLDYQDADYARLYLTRLAPVAELETRHGDGSGKLLAETARELALGMAYEDTVRVAELKIRPGRFARVREEVKVEDGQILEIAEFLHPRVQEIADTLPEKWGQWLLDSGWPRRLVERFTHKGRVLKTSTIRGFLTLYIVAALKPTRPRSLRFKTEQALIETWLAAIAATAPRDYALAAEIAMCRTLVKGYSDTHERGRKNFETLMALLPDLTGRPDAAAKLASLRKAALADDTGAAFSVAVKQIRPLSQAAE
jgi:indolepyruvate ferredoxin oxidoreductase beta subunit